MTPVIMFLGTTRPIDQDREGLAQWCLNALIDAGLSIPVVACNETLILPVNAARINSFKRATAQILRAIQDYKINTLISVNHPWILPISILEAVNYHAFNIHNGKLPHYKGNNILSHMILNREKTATTTIHWMHEIVDMGDVAYEETINIAVDETAGSLYKRINEVARVNFLKLVSALTTGELIPRRPVQGEGTFYKRDSIDKLKEIKDPMDYNEVDLKSRAFYCSPFESAYYIVNGTKFYVSRKS